MSEQRSFEVLKSLEGDDFDFSTGGFVDDVGKTSLVEQEATS